MEVLKQEDEKIISEIIETYEDYKKSKEQISNKTKHEQFADKLYAGISLEEQHEFSKEVCNRVSEEKIVGKENTNSLPEDLLK